MSWWVRRCPAKVNLSLSILGYDEAARLHYIDSVLAKISLEDELRISPSAKPEVTVSFSAEAPCDDIADIDPAANTLARAYAALEAAAGAPLPGLKVEVVKRIPPASGLGGGSSDAAGLLRFFQDFAGNRTRDLQLPASIHGLTHADWMRLAAEVGADVPSFMYDGVTRVRGHGELAEPIALVGLEKCRCQLALPAARLSTADMYSLVKEYSTENHTEAFVRTWLHGDPEAALQSARNDFTPLVLGACAEAAAAFDELSGEQPLLCQVSGSGSAVFSVLPREDGELPAGCYDFLV
jgi:4-diphosphocytidyl-2-C-methyl-D-erythritol kinase